MTENASQFVGSIPDFYDRCLVPVIFEDYAQMLADQVCRTEPQATLELACGTGAVTALVREGLPKSARLIASDLNADMFAIAQGKVSGTSLTDFQTVDAMSLPFEDQSFDCLFCQFGVMFFPDKVASYREALRVLKPGGTYFFNVWNSLAKNPFSQIVEGLMGDMFKEDPPAFYRVPFHYHDMDQIRQDLEDAGFQNIALGERPITKAIQSLEDFTEGLVRGNPISQELRERGTDPDVVISKIREAFQESFGREDPTMPLNAIFVSGSKSAAE